MNTQQNLGNPMLATALLVGAIITTPVIAHQDMKSNDHHGQQNNVGASMMMTEKMSGMDMSAMMERMSSMDISMMMGNSKGIEMMRRMGVTNLTEDQQVSINTLHDSMRKSHWELMGSAMDEQASLRDALSIDRPDAKQVGEIYGRLFDLKRQMIEFRIDTHNNVLDVLTAEQATQMRENMMMSGNHEHEKSESESQ